MEVNNWGTESCNLSMAISRSVMGKESRTFKSSSGLLCNIMLCFALLSNGSRRLLVWLTIKLYSKAWMKLKIEGIKRYKRKTCYFMSGWREVLTRGIELNQSRQNPKWHKVESCWNRKPAENAFLTPVFQNFSNNSLSSFILSLAKI